MPAVSSDCPDAATLHKYAVGAMPAHQATVVERHLESCPRCGEAVDAQLARTDPLIRVVRTADLESPAPTVESAWVRKAAEHDSVNAAADETRIEAKYPVVPRDEFLRAVQQSGLVAPAELQRLAEEADSTASDGDSQDAPSLALRLIEQGKLTRFQAKALVRGHWRGLVLGNYEVQETLAAGGMGRVFRARHRHLDRTVCLKVLHRQGRQSPEMVERFKREAKTIASLSHPHIVAAHDAAEQDGIPYLVMELIDGRDFSRRVKEDGPLAPREAVEVLIQAADGLAYAHRVGIVHRDIKPHNLMADANGIVKLLDLGLASIQSLNDGDTPSDVTSIAARTDSAAIMGTVDYMAPEQAMNSRHADARSDIYSLGCTLWYLLTGRAMFGGETLMEKLIAHREQPIPKWTSLGSSADSPSDVPPRPEHLDVVLSRMVAKRPADRYESMEHVRSELRRILAGQDPVAAPLTANDDAPVPQPPPVAAPPVNSAPVATPPMAVAVAVDSQGPATGVPQIQAEPSVTATESGSIRSRRKKKASILTPMRALAAGAIAIAVVVGIAVWMNSGPAPIVNTKPVRRAALVVLPARYDGKAYKAVTQAMDKAQIRYIAVSAFGDKCHGDDGSAMHTLRLADKSETDYDGMILIPSHHAATYSEKAVPEIGSVMRRWATNKNLLFLATVGSARTLVDQNSLVVESIEQSPSMRVGRLAKFPTHVIVAKSGSDANELIQSIYERLGAAAQP